MKHDNSVGCIYETRQRALMLASVASMIDQFNMPNIRLLLAMGCEVHVACNFREGNTCDEKRIRKMKKELRRMHVTYHQWDCPRSIYACSKCVRAYWQLCRLLHKYHFSCLHCHSPIGSAIARMAAHGKKIRVIYTAHGFHFYRGSPIKNWMLYYPFEKLLSYWTDCLVTVNREDYHLAQRRLHARWLFHIPGVGIDISRFQNGQPMKAEEKRELRKQYEIPSNAVVLLSVGELSKRKNHKMVLSVLPHFVGKNVYYLICGQGVCEKELLKQAKQLGIEEYVRLAGYVEDPVKIYQMADIFVFPSRQEGMPVALMEAMAAGLACAVSDIRGNRELIGQDVPEMRFLPDDGSQLMFVLERLIEDKQLRKECGIRNGRRVKSYSLAMVQEKMQEIYQKNLEVNKSYGGNFSFDGRL